MQQAKRRFWDEGPLCLRFHTGPTRPALSKVPSVEPPVHEMIFDVFAGGELGIQTGLENAGTTNVKRGFQMKSSSPFMTNLGKDGEAQLPV